MEHGILVVDSTGGQLVLGELGEKTYGNISLKIRDVGGGVLRYTVHNGGKPYPAPIFQAGGSAWIPEPFLFRDVYILVPKGTVVRHAHIVRAAHAGDFMAGEAYHAISYYDQKQSSIRIPDSDQYHCLEGGQTAFWDVLEPDTKNVVIESGRDDAKKFLKVEDGYESPNFPLLKQFHKMFSIDENSIDRHTSELRNLGWYLHNFNYRFGGNKDLAGWYNTGTYFIEGHSNARYDAPLYCFENWLKNDDDGAFELGIEMVKRKWALGYYKCDSIPPKHQYKSCGEKSAYRIGDFMSGSPEKTWHMSTVMAAAITGDADLVECTARLQDNLLAQGNGDVWNKSWGSRKIYRYLENLKVHYDFNGDEQVKLRAEAFINHVFSVLTPEEIWFPNLGNGIMTPIRPWMQGKAMSGILQWVTEHNVGNQHLPKIKEMIDHFLKYYLNYLGTNDEYASVYYSTLQPYNGQPVVPTGIQSVGANTANFMQFLPMAIELFPEEDLYKNVYVKMGKLVYGSLGTTFTEYIQNGPVTQLNITPGIYGSSGLKTWLGIAMATRDEWIKNLDELIAAGHG